MRHAHPQADEWKQVPVLIRMDIYTGAGEKGLNISDECNRALANLLNIAYQEPDLSRGHQPVPPPGQTGEGRGPAAAKRPAHHRQVKPLSPVMDAEEYFRTGKIAVRRQPHAAQAEVTRAETAKPESHVLPPHPLPRRSKRGHGREYGTVKKFYETKIEPVAEGSGTDTRISKEDMYQEFLKWSVAHALEPIPDKKLFGEFLKKRFSIADLTVKGSHYWVNVQIR